MFCQSTMLKSVFSLPPLRAPSRGRWIVVLNSSFLQGFAYSSKCCYLNKELKGILWPLYSVQSREKTRERAMKINFWVLLGKLPGFSS